MHQLKHVCVTLKKIMQILLKDVFLVIMHIIIENQLFLDANAQLEQFGIKWAVCATVKMDIINQVIFAKAVKINYQKESFYKSVTHAN